jgi:hypothetical protein
MGGLMHCITTHIHDASCIFASEDFPALIYSLKLDTLTIYSRVSFRYLPASPDFLRLPIPIPICKHVNSGISYHLLP